MTAQTHYYETFDTPLGPFTVVVTDDGDLRATAFGGLQALAMLLGEGKVTASKAITANARREVGEYFAGERKTFDLPLVPAGTDFQRRYWDQLQSVPFGSTTTYWELARRLGSSPRAIGRANATNPISLIIPCHRVVGVNGSLTGYAYGLEVKRGLLEHEGALFASGSNYPTS
jgi:methylated-DNA-[protein]-cysteine S-methyltransferase